MISAPNPAGLSSQLRPLIDLWSECVEELKKYDRAQRGDRHALSADAYEALPSELRTGDHPEYESWLGLWRDFQTEDGGPLIPISSFAALKGIEQRTVLTRKQSEQIVATADALDFGIEPDVRLTGRNYRWEDVVALFGLEPPEPEVDLGAYRAASVLLELGVDIAEADGHISEQELAQISHQLEHRFKLTANQAKRLQCRQHALLRKPDGSTRIAAVLQKTLSREQRLLIGEFLVGVAAADAVISPKEAHALRKAYRSIGLQASDLDNLLTQHKRVEKPTVEATDGEPTFVLDMQAIARKTAETTQVAELLARALADDAVNLDKDTSDFTSVVEGQGKPLRAIAGLAATTTPVYEGAAAGLPLDKLDSRFHGFLAELLTREIWARAELDSSARKSHLMLLGAVDAINEWSRENLGDFLVDGDDMITVNTSLLPSQT
jgi:uncharacterized tellurite resistance protein B-like protein